MFKKFGVLFVLVAVVLGGVVSTSPRAIAQDDEFLFGVVLVGPKDDHGWSQAHYDAGLYVQEKVPGARMIELESLNSADRPETTLDQVVEDMVAQGAKLILTTSADFEVTRVVAGLPSDSSTSPVSALWGIPGQPRQYHGQDGIRQDDRRLRLLRPDRQDRLCRPADRS